MIADLARRCLLPEDAAEAEAITAVLTRGKHHAVFHEDVGVAIGSVGHKDPSAGHVDLLMVDPAHRRKGIARNLLAQLESRFREDGLTSVKITGNAPDYAWPGVDVRYTPAICVLTKAGYTHSRTAWNMTAPLPPPPAGEPPEGMTINSDLQALLPIINAQWGPSWTAEVERARGVHVALRDGVPVAFAAWGGCRPSWFGPMGTLPGATGLGLGALLLKRCLQDQADLGLTSAQIGWVGPVPFYANTVDAYIERVFFLFEKKL